METKKDILNFCYDAVFYDYKNIGIIQEIDQVRKCIINSFYKTFPYTRIIISLSKIDDIILKIVNDDTEKILENIHVLRENIIYMLTGEKRIRDELKTNVNE